MDSVGRVELVKSEVCIVKGMHGIGLGSVVGFSSDAKGIVLGFDGTDAEVVMLNSFSQVRKGDLVRVLSPQVTVNVGKALLGRVIDPLGNPLDGMGQIELHGGAVLPVEAMARPVYQRRLINQALHTGYLTIDSQIPIGLGQRELLLGEKKSGQNELAVDIICNQARLDTSMICVYVLVDAETAVAKRRIERLQANGGLARTVVVMARTAEAASLNYIAPMAGATVAEWFASQGKDVLIVFDNLTRHAKAYRQMSLLLERPATREAYPGDVFYLHARLLERSGAFSKDAGGGSITALPIVETQTEDVTDFITTNLMSITDGHVLFRQTLANKGGQPPIDVRFSVSRVGGRAQSLLVRHLSEKLKGIIIGYESVEGSMLLNGDLSGESLAAYELGLRAKAVLQQGHDDFYTEVQECALMYLVISRRISTWSELQVPVLCQQFLAFIAKPPYDTILTPAVVEMPYDRAETILKECFDDFKKHPDTIKPTEKPQRLMAEIETLDGLLSNNEEVLS